jgi:two-component system, OmpR family, phosphate regulon sensor histidine kinase PhoR
LIRRRWQGVTTAVDELARRLSHDGVSPDLREMPLLLDQLIADHDGRLRHANQQLEGRSAILDSFDEPVLVIDTAQTIVFANQAAAEFLQTDIDRLVNSPAQQVMTHTLMLEVAQSGLSGEHRTERINLTTRQGERIIEAISSPVVSRNQPAGAVFLLRDVTDLARAARMKTDFVANASHELRTPIASIKAALETARSAHDDPETARRFIDMIPAHLGRLEEMTRDLIDLSRLENPNLSLESAPLSLSELTHSLNEIFQDRAQDLHVQIIAELAPELEGFPTNARLVHLILKNLLDNALKFCNENSTVHLVGTVFSNNPRQARFEVRDEGIGVPINQQRRIFERFYQVDAAKLSMPRDRAPLRGTGLGLAIVKHAVGALHGEVGVDSVYQKGTTVWFVIPELRP